MLKNSIYFFLVIGFLSACTRDDLCPADTATTPNLVIVFNDYENRDRRKPVEGISIETMEPERIRVLERSTRDSVALPLNINADNTGYRFIKTTISGSDTIRAIQEIRFLYNRNDVYINRACGFRAEFRQLNVQEENVSGSAWIKEINIKRDSVVDETKAHIVILH